MKNVIMLVIDSMTYKAVSTHSNKVSSTPFLDQLSKKSINFENMYSQAPYTEAAMVALTCGCSTLDNKGYFFRNDNASNNMFRYFRNEGYESFYFAQPFMYPSSMMKDTDYPLYGYSFLFMGCWTYRLEYYADLYAKNEIRDDEWDDIIEILRDNLYFWRDYTIDIKEHTAKADFIWEATPKDRCDEVIAFLDKEIEEFEQNRKAYLIELLKERKDHRLFSVKDITMTEKLKNEELKNNIRNRYKDTFQQFYKMNRNTGLKKHWIDLIKLGFTFIASLFNKNINSVDVMKKINYYRKRLFDNPYTEILAKYDNYRPDPSHLKFIQYFMKWEDTRKEKEKPYFAYIHTADLHSPEAIFSFDFDDEERVVNEIETLRRYAKSLKGDFDSNLLYLLSVRFTDLQLQEIFENLEQSGKLKDTIVVITADHGSSFMFEPVRNQIVNNFYDESYHIPCVIYGEDIKQQTVSKYCNTNDLCATILDLCGKEKPKDFTGISVFHDDHPNIAKIEFYGGGCPDYRRRKVWLGARNSYYSVNFIIDLYHDDLDSLEPVSVYDMQKDKHELKNLTQKKLPSDEQFCILVEYVKNRAYELRKDLM